MCSINVIENYRKIEERVKLACENSGRNLNDVTIIAVSKTKPDEMVRELAGIGVRDFGENKPQELMRKHDEILIDEIAGVKSCADGEKLHWHMIGNLQTNKVKMVVGRAVLIHSVPSLHVAKAISKQADKIAPFDVHILIEVNIADEETKHGAKDSDIYGLVKEIAALPHIVIDGLMAICPPVDNPEDNRIYFRRLRQMRDEIRNLAKEDGLKNVPMNELSMGMTGDFEVAIEEGATYIRVGTAIFGERDYLQK